MSARPRLPLRRLALAGAAGAAVLLALPVAAGAHVEAESETVAGVTTVTFGFHHGCDGAATTSLRVQLPEGATDVEAQDPAGWTSGVTATELTWTGGSIPDGADGTFVATMTLVDAEGTTVFLPTIQGCTGGAEEAWIDKSEDPEAEAAAPRITAGAVVSVGGHDDEGDHGAPETTAADKTTNEAGAGTTTTAKAGNESTTASPATESASSSSSAPLIVGIVAAVVVIGGIIAFLVTRKGSSSGTP